MDEIEKMELAYKAVWHDMSKEEEIFFIQLLCADKELLNMYRWDKLLKRFGQYHREKAIAEVASVETV